MNVIVDDKIDLTEICERHDWHWGSVVGELVQRGLSRADAEEFAAYIFDSAALATDGEYAAPERIKKRISRR